MFRSVNMLLLMMGLLAAAPCGAELAGPEPAPVREIDLSGVLKPSFKTTGKALEPTAIVDGAGLARAFPDVKVRKYIEKYVDFAKETLVYFSWAGSGMDRVSCRRDTQEGKNVTITFLYQAGRSRDLRGHAKLYVIPTDTRWSVRKDDNQ